MPQLERDGEVFVLRLGDDENRFGPDWMAEVTSLLEEVAAAPPPRALVTTATGKFFSNGLDLEWLGANPDAIDEYVGQVHRLFASALVFPGPTVAAIQGHAFAAGAMLALAHDWRVMRTDRGYLCLPEVDINIPFTPGMDALIRAKLTPSAATEAMLTGRRFGGPEALSAGLVTATAGEAEVLSSAVELARPLASKDPGTLGKIKERMYAEVLAVLRDEDANRMHI